MKDSRTLEYNGISFSCIHSDRIKENLTLKDSALIYLSGGRLEIHGPDGCSEIRPGASVFIRKDKNITLTKSMAQDGTPFKMVTMTFNRSFLHKYYRRIREAGETVSAVRSEHPVMIIPPRADVDSLFQSLMPFFWSDEKPDNAWTETKKAEGLQCILKTDSNQYASLFDFAGPWKIDLAEFMENNFMAELSLDEFANYTGRSLSSFNRDFRKIYGMPPERWLIGKRLELARTMLLKGGRSVTAAMSDSGFSNLSYFSRKYRETFGISPREEIERQKRGQSK